MAKTYLARLARLGILTLISLAFVNVRGVTAQTVTPNPSVRAPAVAPVALPRINTVPNLSLGNGVRVTRTLNLSQFQRSRPIALGSARLNLAELASPNNQFNRSIRQLQSLGNLVTVRQLDSQLIETNKGVIVSRAMIVQPKLGACTTNRSQLNRAGNICGNRTTLQASLRAMQTRGNPRYIANAADRRRAEQNLRSSAAKLQQDVQRARQSLSDPRVIRQIGQTEVNRLRALSDDDLAAEMIDAGETVISEAIFIPNIDNVQAFDRIRHAQISPQLGPREIAAAQQRLQQMAIRAKPQNLSLQQTTFLTGFTFGKEYEWRKRIQKTINWCIVGCAETHYVEPYAKLGFGLGLRFPIKAKLQFNYQQGDTAQLRTDFQAFDGGEEDYRAAGLERGKLFNGKELVAQYVYKAGVKWKLLNGDQSFELGEEEDFTKYLPPPFTNGNFRPPSPGRPTPVLTKVFNDIDLLGQQMDYGVVGATLYPAVNITMTSAELSLSVEDKLSGRKVRVGTNRNVPVRVDQRKGESKFVLGEPRYNLAFNVKPGLQYSFFVDLVVWDKDWTDILWIPQLELTLPPGGVDFACHAGTNCHREFIVDLASGNSAATDRNGPPKNCVDGIKSRVSAIKVRATGEYVRGGVTAEGRNDVVGALAGRKRPTNNRSWESFELITVPSGPHKNATWIRNTMRNRYLETVNRTSTLLLPANRRCDPSNPDLLWIVENRGRGGIKFQNVRTKKFVRVQRNGLLKADATRNNATVFVVEPMR